MCSRQIGDKTIEFGTTGYTMNNTFVLYDRDTESVWYPLTDKTMDAVSGKRKGEAIKFVAKPELMPLGEWAKQHPDTQVLIPAPRQGRGADQQGADARQRVAQDHPVLGTWDMHTSYNGRQLPATMTLSRVRGRLSGTWSSQGSEMALSDLRVDGETLRFTRRISDEQSIEFEGTLAGDSITGTAKSPWGELETTGKRQIDG